ncbi:hypothetical protein BDZ91DRAFT_735929 [Kalaharituber pfeilii]|nr:hypothetical protein BDZ91DRAFT_735929 [Kalaharituber pfeilii]
MATARIEYVADLKEAIKKEVAPELDAYSITDLTIKAKYDDKDPENAVELDPEDDLKRVLERVGKQDSPVSSAKNIRFFVFLPLVKASLSELRTNEPSKKRKRDEKEIQDILATFPKKGPSNVLHYPAFEQRIRKSDIKIYANQPLDRSKVPLSLLDPIFGCFCDLWTTIDPTAKDNYAFLVLRSVMLKGYHDEIERETAVHNFFRDHFKISLHSERASAHSTTSLSDGHAYTSCGKFIRLLVEVRNEITGISSDPYFQAQMVYRDYLDRLIKEEGDYLSKSTIPVMIVLIFGTYFQITGVLVKGKSIFSEPFTPAFSFCSDPYDEYHRLAVTRCLAALRESLLALDQHYKGLPGMPNLPSSETVFPYKTSYIPLDGGSNPVSFEYLSRLLDNSLLFLAKADSDFLVIKYTRQYSREAHELLSDKGFAPKLQGLENIPGGWKMVIMQYVGEPYKSLSKLGSKSREQFRDSIMESISLLHANGFVHGDLRPSNVLVSEPTEKALIIDFDKAGEANSVNLPNLNTIDIVRPEGGMDGNPITMAHDNFMFKKLFDSEST